MINLKKILALVLTLTLAISLVACGSSQSTPDQTSAEPENPAAAAVDIKIATVGSPGDSLVELCEYFKT